MTDDDRFNQLLAEALEKEPAYELPKGFSERVMAMVEKQSLKKESLRDRWWIIAGIVMMIGAVVYVVLKVKLDLKPDLNLDLTFGVFTFFKGYWGLAIFGIIFITALHIVDKLILRKQESG